MSSDHWVKHIEEECVEPTDAAVRKTAAVLAEIIRPSDRAAQSHAV